MELRGITELTPREAARAESQDMGLSSVSVPSWFPFDNVSLYSHSNTLKTTTNNMPVITLFHMSRSHSLRITLITLSNPQYSYCISHREPEASGVQEAIQDYATDKSLNPNSTQNLGSWPVYDTVSCHVQIIRGRRVAKQSQDLMVLCFYRRGMDVFVSRLVGGPKQRCRTQQDAWTSFLIYKTWRQIRKPLNVF